MNGIYEWCYGPKAMGSLPIGRVLRSDLAGLAREGDSEFSGLLQAGAGAVEFAGVHLGAHGLAAVRYKRAGDWSAITSWRRVHPSAALASASVLQSVLADWIPVSASTWSVVDVVKRDSKHCRHLPAYAARAIGLAVEVVRAPACTRSYGWPWAVYDGGGDWGDLGDVAERLVQGALSAYDGFRPAAKGGA